MCLNSKHLSKSHIRLLCPNLFSSLNLQRHKIILRFGKHPQSNIALIRICMFCDECTWVYRGFYGNCVVPSSINDIVSSVGGSGGSSPVSLCMYNIPHLVTEALQGLSGQQETLDLLVQRCLPKRNIQIQQTLCSRVPT